MGRHAVVAHQAFQRIGGIVFAANRQQRGLTAERGNIAGNVGGAAGTVFGFGDSRHRHRRFGRNARHVAKPVAVEHHVAHHQHAGGGKILALGNAVNHTALQSQRRGRQAAAPVFRLPQTQRHGAVCRRGILTRFAGQTPPAGSLKQQKQPEPKCRLRETFVAAAYFFVLPALEFACCCLNLPVRCRLRSVLLFCPTLIIRSKT